MQSPVEELLVNIFAQMPFVLLIYYMYRGEREERLKAQAELVASLRTTIDKNEARHTAAYDRACQLYERALDQATDALKIERNRARKVAASTDVGEHATQPKIGL